MIAPAGLRGSACHLERLVRTKLRGLPVSPLETKTILKEFFMTRRKIFRLEGCKALSVFSAAIFCLLLSSPASAYHGDEKKPAPGFVGSLKEAGENLVDVLPSDASYFFGSILDDMIDLVKLPTEENGITAKEILAGTVLVGSIPATIYGLDNPIRRNIRNMNDGTASALNYVGLGTTVGSLGVVYGLGVLSRNDDARHVALTGVRGIGMASLVNLSLKFAFGRERPSKGDGPRAFFKGGDSFPSAQSTIAFAAATALSEGFNNRWWAAVPAYSFALMTGIGRMGKDAHWASDVLTSSLIGVGTTELLFYLHRRREWPTSSLTIMPMVTERGVAGAAVGFSW